MEKLKIKNGGLFITNKKPFSPLRAFKQHTIRKTIVFAYEMSFGKQGEHRNYRSGGSHFRGKGEIFANTFQGKLSEFAVFNELYNEFEMETPDLSTYGLGDWDDWDFMVKEKKISIKSTKNYGNLLLLEQKDWGEGGEYRPNIIKGSSLYDFFIFVRIKPSAEDLLKENRAFYSNNLEINFFEGIFLDKKWEYDIPGFVTLEELKYIISNKFIIKKGEMLNGKTKMDADNYYIQAGDMNPIENLKKILRR